MSALFTDEARLGLWLEVEVLAVEAWASVGVIPTEDAKAVRERAPAVTPALVTAVQEREQVTDHDVAAFVDVVQAAIGAPAGKWVHYGLTSSDVVDTALCLTLTRAADLLIDASGDLVAALKAKALEFRDTPMVGRTHGMHAEPTTFGAKLALWCLQADRDRASGSGRATPSLSASCRGPSARTRTSTRGRGSRCAPPSACDRCRPPR